MIQTLEERHDDQIPPKPKTYVYRCPRCGSLIQFDNSDIIHEWDWEDDNHYVWCPICKHQIESWWLWRWAHRLGFYKLFHKINS